MLERDKVGLMLNVLREPTLSDLNIDQSRRHSLMGASVNKTSPLRLLDEEEKVLFLELILLFFKTWVLAFKWYTEAVGWY